jgi:hypothetical protein
VFLYYHSRTGSARLPSGSYAVFYGNAHNYASDTREINEQVHIHHYVYFSGKGSGSGRAVKNNAAAAISCSTITRDNYRIHYGSGCTGHSQEFDAADYCLEARPSISTRRSRTKMPHWAQKGDPRGRAGRHPADGRARRVSRRRRWHGIARRGPGESGAGGCAALPGDPRPRRRNTIGATAHAVTSNDALLINSYSSHARCRILVR